jgi:hypothetical protein
MGKVSAGTVAAIVVALLLVLAPVSSLAADNTVYKLPWEKFNVQAGAFFASLDDKVQVGVGGVGVTIDVEETLGMETQNTSFRVGGSYRIGEERRHRVDLEYFYFNRNSTKTLAKDITIDNVTFFATENVDATFNFQIVKAAYSYSFFQDDRMDLAASIGLFVMPLKFEVNTSQGGGKNTELNFTAPLPVLGFRGDFAITPKWFLRTKLEFFYLEYQNFTGGLMDTNIAVEYNPWKNWGFGFGVENFRLKLSAEGSDYPNLNFNGDVKMQFIGAQLYARYFF